MKVDLDAKVEDITVGMQQRVEILKMLYRDNEVLIFDEPTAVLTPQEIEELMEIMAGLKREGKSILFISHKLNEIMAVSDRVTVLRKGQCIGTVNTCDTTQEELSRMMVGRPVQLVVEKKPAQPGKEILRVEKLCVPSKLYNHDACITYPSACAKEKSFALPALTATARRTWCMPLTGLEKISTGRVTLCGHDITHAAVRERSQSGMSHIPGGPAQARPGAGLHPGAEHGAPALSGAAVPKPWVYPL